MHVIADSKIAVICLFDGSDVGVLPLFAQGTTSISAADAPHSWCVFHNIIRGQTSIFLRTRRMPISAAIICH